MFLHVFVSTWVMLFVLHGAARLAGVHVHGNSITETKFWRLYHSGKHDIIVTP